MGLEKPRHNAGAAEYVETTKRVNAAPPLDALDGLADLAE